MAEVTISTQVTSRGWELLVKSEKSGCEMALWFKSLALSTNTVAYNNSSPRGFDTLWPSHSPGKVTYMQAKQPFTYNKWQRQRQREGADWSQQLHAALTELTASHSSSIIARLSSPSGSPLIPSPLTRTIGRNQGINCRSHPRSQATPSFSAEIRSSAGHQKLVSPASYLATEDECCRDTELRLQNSGTRGSW